MRLWAAVATEEQGLNTGSPSPLAEETGAEYAEVWVSVPAAHQLPCRITCPMELSHEARLAMGSRATYFPGMDRLGELQTWTVSELWQHLSS